MAVRKKAKEAVRAGAEAVEEAAEVTKNKTTQAATKAVKTTRKVTKPRKHKDGKRVTRVVITEVQRLPHPHDLWNRPSIEEACEEVSSARFNGVPREQLQDLVDDAEEQLKACQESWDEVYDWEEPLTEEQAFQMRARWRKLREAQRSHRHWVQELDHFNALVAYYLDHGVVPDHPDGYESSHPDLP